MELLTIAEIASKIKRSPKTVYSDVSTGKIPASIIFRIGGSIRIKSTDFLKWLESCRGKNGKA